MREFFCVANLWETEPPVKAAQIHVSEGLVIRSTFIGTDLSGVFLHSAFGSVGASCRYLAFTKNGVRLNTHVHERFARPERSA